MTEHDWRTTDRFRDMAVMLTQPTLPWGGLGRSLAERVTRLLTAAGWYGLSSVGHPEQRKPIVVERSERRMRLLTAACWGRLWTHLPVPESRTRGPLSRGEWVDLMTRFADGRQTPEDAEWERECSVRMTEGDREGVEPAITLQNATGHYHQLWHLAGALGPIPIFAGVFPEHSRLGCDLIRDLFGNPFRKVEFNPEWRTSTAAGLAEAVYEDNAFDRMPILADALEDAGCDDPELLTHCREGPVHVRGCWVVDRVLGNV